MLQHISTHALWSFGANGEFYVFKKMKMKLKKQNSRNALEFSISISSNYGALQLIHIRNFFELKRKRNWTSQNGKMIYFNNFTIHFWLIQRKNFFFLKWQTHACTHNNAELFTHDRRHFYWIIFCLRCHTKKSIYNKNGI